MKYLKDVIIGCFYQYSFAQTAQRHYICIVIFS